ncbi:hypothetical protein [Autumnicola musiva]|uniref:GIY-YIG domain-containing protein n=1 Tax=Autumnicola musiva TaxID=3075589 RepID=A0ABU3D650_9FLAO|nr:hypothetical protein [Zunongwangia sp. F117]MDT0677010.1 hypothetical protein [Zunongwangia sp. F117]
MSEEYLKNFIKLSEAIYDSAEEILIKPSKTWNDNILKKEWFDKNCYSNKYITMSPGWYWIACDLNFEEVKKLNSSNDALRRNACKIGELSRKNIKTFGAEYLCKLDDDGKQIIYNGHQNNVVIRLRQHFNLNNDSTGALGLNCYPLSKKTGKLGFLENLISKD